MGLWIKPVRTASILPTSASAHRHSCQRRPPEPKFAFLSEAVEAARPPRILIAPSITDQTGFLIVHTTLVNQTAHWKLTRIHFLR